MNDDALTRLAEFPDVMTVQEVCRALRISQATFYRHPGLIERIKGLPVPRYSKEAVAALIRGDEKATRGLRVIRRAG